MTNNSISASIVTYNTDITTLKKVIDSFLGITFDKKLIIVDNSKDDTLKRVVSIDSENILYIHNPTNTGFGSGHNIAIKKAVSLYKSEYHIILNPDIYFDKSVVKSLVDFTSTDPSIGLVMPKVLYPNGDTQYLCKLLPTPADLILRRFLPSEKLKKKRTNRYELKSTNYNKVMDIPSLSGCFMFLRTNALKQVGGFDERFFMYLEDVDLCRRIQNNYRTVFYPKAFIYHEYDKGSYKNKKLFKYHMTSAIKYFNKWGWFFDSERKKINNKTLKNITNPKLIKTK